jgi:hypothetical protein
MGFSKRIFCRWHFCRPFFADEIFADQFLQMRFLQMGFWVVVSAPKVAAQVMKAFSESVSKV